MSPRPNFRGRLRPALIFELGRIGSEHLPNDLPRDPKLPADRLDRPLLNEIRPADLRNRLHDQHPELGLHVPWKPVWTLIPGVPFGCRSPRKRGPYSTPIHSPLLCAIWPWKIPRPECNVSKQPGEKMPYRGKGCPSCQYLHSARRIIAQCTAFSGAVHFDS